MEKAAEKKAKQEADAKKKASENAKVSYADPDKKPDEAEGDN